jgi:hypothetical protein
MLLAAWKNRNDEYIQFNFLGLHFHRSFCMPFVFQASIEIRNLFFLCIICDFQDTKLSFSGFGTKDHLSQSHQLFSN